MNTYRMNTISASANPLHRGDKKLSKINYMTVVKMKITILLLALFGPRFGFSNVWAGTPEKPAQITIENDTVWKDTDGNEILCQGGGIYEENSVYYWVGTDMTFDGIKCYSSKDLKNWAYRGYLFKMEESTRFSKAKGRSSVIRPTLLKNPVSNKYVLIFFEGRGTESLPKIAFAESDSLMGGKYIYKGNTLLDNCIPNDQSVVKIGNDAYIVWKAPYQFNISKALQSGKNTLEVTVVQTWNNRIIGDQQLGATPRVYMTRKMGKATDPLQPSGLLGPVRVQSTNIIK